MPRLTMVQRIGRRIREVRVQRGYSLRQLVELSSVGSFTHLSNVEQGKAAPTVRTLVELAKALDVSIRAFIPTDLEARADLIARVDALPASILPELASCLDVLERAPRTASPKKAPPKKKSTRRG